MAETHGYIRFSSKDQNEGRPAMADHGIGRQMIFQEGVPFCPSKEGRALRIAS